MNNTRIKVNLQTGEIEFEGSEEFVENQLENLDSLIELIVESRGATLKGHADDFETETKIEQAGESNPSLSEGLNTPGNFGEWMHKFRDDLSGNDKALITAYYVQKQSADDDFKTREVNKSLKEHGIKLGNPSETLKRLVEKKFLFQTRKAGAVKFFRVSQDGQKNLKSLLRR